MGRNIDLQSFKLHFTSDQAIFMTIYLNKQNQRHASNHKTKHLIIFLEIEFFFLQLLKIISIFCNKYIYHFFYFLIAGCNEVQKCKNFHDSQCHVAMCSKNILTPIIQAKLFIYKVVNYSIWKACPEQLQLMKQR